MAHAACWVWDPPSLVFLNFFFLLQVPFCLLLPAPTSYNFSLAALCSHVSPFITYVYTRVYKWTCIYACVHIEAKVNIWCLPQWCSTLCVETMAITELGVHQLHWSGWSPNCLCLTRCWDYRNVLLHPDLHMNAGDLNSGVQNEQPALSRQSHLHCPFPSFVNSRVKQRTVLLDCWIR